VVAADRHQVVVIGGGFGGVAVTKGLKRADVDVTLGDRTNHHLFQPLLYQVAAGILSEGTIAPPLRGVIDKQKNARVVLAELTRFDLENRIVHGVAPDGRKLQRRYDTLVVAAGVNHDYFGHDEWAKHAPGMKTIEDARRLRSRILAAFELAETVPEPEERAALLTFVVIGGGPTGVELVGQLSELARRVLRREFRWLDTRAEVRVVLVEAGPAVLGPFHERLRDYTKRRLEKMGVEVRVGTMATEIDADGITVRSAAGGEERIACRTKIWAAGVRATPLAGMLAEAAGAKTDRAGRLLVNDNCTLPGHPEVFAIGDMVSLQGLPGVAQPAIQEGKYVARVIRARLDGEQDDDLEPFRYVDKGSMATIGWKSAVSQSMGMRFTGFIGYAMWAFIHVMYLVGWGNRFATMYSWLRSLVFTRNRGQRIITVDQVQTESHEVREPVP
jgi:NADH dehydrogenase